MQIKQLFIISILFLSFLEANKTFEANLECKKCHPLIYKEHQGAMHNKATIFKDPIHKAIWDKHPLNIKKQQYKCAKCHTPTADNLSDMLEKGKKGLPDLNNTSHNEAISCAYCHRIESVEHGMMTNKNIISSEPKDYFGGMKKPLRNKFHYQAKNENFVNGNVCMGCHSHKKNKEMLDVCVTDMPEPTAKDNCITCHMPQVEGSISDKEDTPTHSYHGFPGANSGHKMLSKYIEVKLIQNTDGFEVSVHNKSPHDLLLHPLRYTELHVSVTRGSEVHNFNKESFVRVIGKNKKATPPWLANEIVKNTMIKAKETRIVKYVKDLQTGDEVKIVLGFYLVNPKALAKFSLKGNEKVEKFNILKKEIFIIKE